jgi:hypothetical protein
MGLEAAAIGTLAGWLGTTVLGGAAVAGGISMANSSANMAKKQKAAMQTSPMSAIPAPTGGATEVEKAKIRKKKPTILTSPLTGGEDFGGSAPTLLGTGDTTKKATLG